MNWLAHIFLSESNTENRLGNLLGDLVKGKEIDRLNDGLKIGIDRHKAIDKFTDSHPVVKLSKARIDPAYRRFGGVLVDIFYDRLLANHWADYTHIPLAQFTQEIYTSFQGYSGEIPAPAREIIQQMIDGDWLSSYQYSTGIENALTRIDTRIEHRTGKQTNLAQAAGILDREYTSFERDFQQFFPDLQKYIETRSIDSVLLQ